MWHLLKAGFYNTLFGVSAMTVPLQESAGFDPKKSRFTYHEIELIEELKKVATLIGRTPSTREFAENSTFSSSTVIQRLGSWVAACKKAGLSAYVPQKPPSPPGGWNKGMRKFNIAEDDLRYFYEVEGLSASAIAAQFGVHHNTVLRRMHELGIKVKKLHYSMPRETSIETKLYQELEKRKVTFVKQQVVDGLWVVDALIPGARIAIECDGAYWHSLPEMVERDKKKDAYLKSRGYQVFRFPEEAINADVKGCVQRIVDALIDVYKKE
jgi:very-short-patch-repair endonuclease